MYDGQTILITTVVGFLSTLIALFVQAWRESRNRRWDIEDRRNARRDTEAKMNVQTEEIRLVATREAELKQAVEETNRAITEEKPVIDETLKEVQRIAEAVAEGGSEKAP